MTDEIQKTDTLPPDWLLIESLDLEAQGVAHRADGKVVFIKGALPFELVSATVHRKKNNWEQGVVTAIHRESSQRVQPGCPHFGLHEGACGGCKMQHLHIGAQVAVKQRVLEDNLWHLGKVKADNILRPIEGPAWGYRYRARISVRHVRKKGAVLVGFHERKSGYVADMKECHVLPPHVSDLLLPLRALITSMDAIEDCPQIELACGDSVTALVLRHMQPLSEGDLALLRDFAQRHAGVQWWLQPKGVEGSESLVARSRENYKVNVALAPVHSALAATNFVARNLFEMTPAVLIQDGVADKWLIDPPREGAVALVQALADLHQQKLDPLNHPLTPGAEAWTPPKRIVYVSCNPSTLARDAELLVHQAGYRCSLAGVVNMFPHTAHVESMAVFDLEA
jgi:tRNA/tmRNA/rRNA uracil-C5-methylase (TrmA/RlmC/RlmD family)